MACELLAGNLTPREVMSSNAYSDALMSAGKETIAKYTAMSDAEKEALAEQGRARGGGGGRGGPARRCRPRSRRSVRDRRR